MSVSLSFRTFQTLCMKLAESDGEQATDSPEFRSVFFDPPGESYAADS